MPVTETKRCYPKPVRMAVITDKTQQMGPRNGVKGILAYSVRIYLEAAMMEGSLEAFQKIKSRVSP